jgi:hypothetical protein
MGAFMSRLIAIVILLSLSLTSVTALARIRWQEPEVVPEKLTRRDRRVIRFSGETRPGALIRVRKNRVKMYPHDGEPRLAQIPQKNRVQFPVSSGDSGSFTFDLYLPTWAVEIPLEVKERGGQWTPYTLNFRVPEEGKADDFQAIEESFKAQDERMDRAEMDYSFYSRKEDRGQVILDRMGEKASPPSPVEVWAGAGISYFHNSTSVPAPVGATSDGTLVIPTFRLGTDWDFSKQLRLRANIRSTSGSTEGIGNGNTTGRDFNWFEAQASVLYFSQRLKSKKGRIALDVGAQMQTLPFFRLRTNSNNEFLINSAYFPNRTYNIHLGLHYETRTNKVWNYEAYARYLYPLLVGSNFDVRSTIPIMIEAGGGLRRPLTEGLALGIYGQFHYVSMDTRYSDAISSVTSDFSLMLMTVDMRLIANF